MPRISAATNAAQRENTKRAILESFGKLLYSRGLPGLTMTDVAKNAGIGRTAVYNYFADMGELLVAYALDETERFLHELDEGITGVTNPIDQLAVYIRLQIEDLARRHLPPGPAMRSMLSPESYARLGKHVSELQMVLANILSDAITEKYIPENDIRELAMLVHGSLSSSAGRAEDAPDTQTRERQIQSTIRFIQMGLGARFDADGNPLYPQLPVLIAPLIAQNGGGSVPDGRINGKVITVCSILDESALAWHGDWYRNAVRKAKDGDEENWFRLYYNDHCIHDDRAGYLDDKQHQVDYLGVLHQALLDLADWCEKGIAPLPTTSYRLEDGQIKVPATAGERGGLQPVVDARANGEKSITVKAGEPVSFTARIEVPLMAGKVTAASWDYERTDDFSRYEDLLKEEDGRTAYVKTTHVFEKPGTYFPVLKAQSSRDGKLDDIFVQCRNLDRVRVVVE